MGRLSKFEGHLDRAVDNAAGSVFKSPISPVQLTKRAEKEMHRQKLVSAGVQHAPTLYNVLVSPDDDANLAGYYPTLAGEIETYLRGKASEAGLRMDGNPLARFIVDDKLKRGKFDVIAENVSPNIITELRDEEMARYGMLAHDVENREMRGQVGAARAASPQPQPVRQPQPSRQPVQQDYDQQYEDDRGLDVQGSYDEGYDAGYEQPYDEGYDDRAVYQPAPTKRFADQQARLVDIDSGIAHILSGSRVTLGRERGNDIVVPDKNISRNHAEFILDDGIWVVNDLGSTNGTSLNGQMIAQADLRDGDQLTFGMTTFEFQEG